MDRGSERLGRLAKSLKPLKESASPELLHVRRQLGEDCGEGVLRFLGNAKYLRRVFAALASKPGTLDLRVEGDDERVKIARNNIGDQCTELLAQILKHAKRQEFSPNSALECVGVLSWPAQWLRIKS